MVLIFIQITGCQKDFLDRYTLDQLSDESFWSSDNDAISAVNSCYRDFESFYNVLYLDCASDNAFNPYPWEGWTVQANGNLEPTNTGESFFSFTTIRKCNWVLENIDNVPDMDGTLLKRLKAEIRFIRAYRYFLMTQFYGDVPLITKTLSIDEANQSKTSKTEVVSFVLNELTEITPDLPPSYTGSNVGRITRGAALGLKARLLLFEGQYPEAAVIARQVMDLGVYSLFPDYTGIFLLSNENNSEVILDVQYIENDYSNWLIGVMPPSSYGGWSSIDPTQSLVSAYECTDGKTIDYSPLYNPDKPYDNRDPRFYSTILYPGNFWRGKYFDPISPDSPDYYAPYGRSKTAYYPKKYVYPLSQYADVWNTGMNIIVMRYAEILLIYAETKIEINDIDASVYDAINQVRNRAGMPNVDQTVYNNQTTLRELIRRERRVEFGMEGLRWYDIKRWKIAENVLNGKVYGSRPGTVDPTTGEITFSSPDHIFVEDRVFDPNKNYLWPIPQSEIDANPNLKQNPDY